MHTRGAKFRARPGEYQNEGAIILGVSADTAQSHKDFCAKEGLNFKLLADPELKAITEYGSAMEHDGVRLAARNTFLINPEGRVARVFLGVKPAGHSEQVLKEKIHFLIEEDEGRTPAIASFSSHAIDGSQPGCLADSYPRPNNEHARRARPSGENE